MEGKEIMKIKRKIIYGCESRGDGHSPYLTRWTLLENMIGAVYLHKFHRSDSPEHHDHPWAFASLILWRGYLEEVPLFSTMEPSDKVFATRRRRVWPGMFLFRRAAHAHRVVLVKEKPAWTLVVRGPYVRDWGFFTKSGWQRWKEYFTERGC